jgi:F-type H+-transporting ATPase subunit a
MRLLTTTLAIWLLLLLVPATAAPEFPFGAPVLVDLGFFKITNSMVAMWLVALAIIIVAQLATRNVTLIPSSLQNFLETIIEGLQGFLGSIMGDKLARQTFWFFGSVFIFIISANWMGLLPGVGTIGIKHVNDAGEVVEMVPFLRGANADLNTTLALALVFFACWHFWAVKSNGVGGFLSHIFIYHGDGKGAMKVMLLVIFFLVGFLEVVSIAIRPVTLTFRLYGNIYAGESLFKLMLYMGGNLGWLTALPFYFLEMLVGAIQALVFTLLTAVFTSLMCSHEEAEHHDH